MSWDPNKLKMRHIVAAVLLVGGATAAAADILVVRAIGPSAKSYPPGKSLPANARITLRANDQLTVLDGKGTRTLRGPGTFTPGGPARAATGTTLGALTAGQPQRRARIGAVRGPGSSAPRPNTIWHIDVSKSSTVCLADPNSVTLWRADSTQPVALTVTRARDGARREVMWDAGESTLLWPAEMPVADGADYRLTWPGGTLPTTLKFKTLPGTPAGLEQMASWLIRNGCDAQLDLLIETVKLPDDPTTPPAG